MDKLIETSSTSLLIWQIFLLVTMISVVVVIIYFARLLSRYLKLRIKDLEQKRDDGEK